VRPPGHAGPDHGHADGLLGHRALLVNVLDDVYKAL
jgi:hypothetical protein